MALIKCQECATEISSDSKACSKCGHPTKKSLAHLKKLENERIAKEHPVAHAISVTVVVLGFFGIIVWMLSSNDSPKDKQAAQDEGLSAYQALATCKAAMKAASKYPDKAEIPSIGAYSDKDGHMFVWGASTEHMMWMNGLGLMAPTSGSCYVNKTTNTITMLTVNGKTII